MSVFDKIKKMGITKYKVIDRRSIEEITLGASILATGGGGNPKIGLLWALKVLDEGKAIVMIDPEDVPDDILVACPTPLGSSIVLTEKPPKADVCTHAIAKLEHYLGQKVQALIPLECGGVASTITYAVAGELGLPIIDADGMGRAFPELQMTSWATHGVHPTPTVSCDDRMNVTVIDTKEDHLMAESIARKTSMSYGGISWIATYPMRGSDVKRTSIINSQSIAWDVGKSVLSARKEHVNPADQILTDLKEKYHLSGYKVFNGKITDIRREFGGEMQKGFSLGQLKIEGLNEDKGKVATLDFQNEWLNLIVDGQIECTTPDLIIIVDTETGEPIRTDIVKYGYRGTILLLAAQDRMRTENGIKTFGPRYFGYDLDYIPVEERQKNKVSK
ncbi:DUF917 domain-containing protein [Neobacillus cucumis]|uniref:DUF917 domain-containing protein n=1 Tax=Neobacillus cucumis TaxID=1740721 RepID=UPI0018E0188F|nr:DUF917 domain-containing protein [Neobacillus cucumis]MBI0579483.1 DUF917 domain-containing protein [Neobacillus cucumis]